MSEHKTDKGKLIYKLNKRYRRRATVMGVLWAIFFLFFTSSSFYILFSTLSFSGYRPYANILISLGLLSVGVWVSLHFMVISFSTRKFEIYERGIVFPTPLTYILKKKECFIPYDEMLMVTVEKGTKKILWVHIILKYGKESILGIQLAPGKTFSIADSDIGQEAIMKLLESVRQFSNVEIKIVDV